MTSSECLILVLRLDDHEAINIADQDSGTGKALSAFPSIFLSLAILPTPLSLHSTLVAVDVTWNLMIVLSLPLLPLAQ